MTDEEKKEIKYRLSDIGAKVGELALEYIAELEEENEQLQEKLNIRSCQNCKDNNKSCPNDGSCVHYSKWEGYKNLQLTRAKEIIKKFSEIVNDEVEFDPEHPQEHTDLWNELCEKAEEFLNSEVEQ